MTTPFPTSICHQCKHLRLVRSGKGSTFLNCTEPTTPKYQSQPVVACPAWTRLDEPDPSS